MSSNVSGVRPVPELLPLLFIPEPLPLKPPGPEPDKPNRPIIILAPPPPPLTTLLLPLLLPLTPPPLSLADRLPGTPKRPPPLVQHGLREAAILCHLLFSNVLLQLLFSCCFFLLYFIWFSCLKRVRRGEEKYTKRNWKKKEEEQKKGRLMASCGLPAKYTRTHTHTHTHQERKKKKKFDKRVIRSLT